MKIFKLLFVFLLIISCSTKSPTTPTEDCATAYTLDDPEKEMEGVLKAKIRFVIFKDSISIIDTNYLLNSLDLLNKLIYATNKQFENHKLVNI
jgi:hypothetical protein